MNNGDVVGSELATKYLAIDHVFTAAQRNYINLIPFDRARLHNDRQR
jgi:hypothetical protein